MFYYISVMLLISLPTFVYLLILKYVKPNDKLGRILNSRKTDVSVFLLTFLLVEITLYYSIPFTYTFIYILPFVYLGMKKVYGQKCIRNIVERVILAILTTTWLWYMLKTIMSTKRLILLKGDMKIDISIGLIILLIWIDNLIVISFLSINSKESNNDIDGFIRNTLVWMLGAIIIIGILSYFDKNMFNNVNKEFIEIYKEYLCSPVILINILILGLICALFVNLLGKGIGSILSCLICMFIVISNGIKLYYHDTFFSWFDLLQVKEMFLIGKDFLTVKLSIIIITSLVVLVTLLIVFRKRILRFLKPSINVVALALSIVMLVLLVKSVQNRKFSNMGILPYTWENSKVNVYYNGLIINMCYDLENLSNAKLDKPSNYCEESAKELEEDFSEFSTKYTTDNNQEKPTVILILAESLFDLDGIEGIEFSQDIDSTIEKYSQTKMISPRYGGYTSAMEFEVLTGMSLAFMPDGLTPYTTYFSNVGDAFPGVARCFSEDGYEAKAIHPNLGEFYNRSNVYKELGFDSFDDIQSFECNVENTTDNGWLLDSALGDRIISEVDSTDNPQFIFAITMEAHYVNQDKFTDPEVKVVSNDYEFSDSQINEIEQQATSYKDTDEMIKNIISYMDSTDKPILLYVFGDHLPPMTAFGNISGYLDDKYNKYTTTYVTYSNYKNILEDDEYITPNQIGAQILIDANVPHPSYFDYIYSLRKSIPVLQKEFLDVNDKQLDIYRFVQYDIMFGKRYLCD